MKLDRESHRNPEAYKSRRGGVVRSAVFMGLFLMASITLAWMLALPTVIGIKIEKDTGNQWEAESVACNPFGPGSSTSDCSQFEGTFEGVRFWEECGECKGVG